MTDHKLHILMHALGLDDLGRTSRGEGPRYTGGKTYRNHYVSEPTPELEALAAEGLMVKRRGGSATGYDPVFYVTDAGRAFVVEHLPPLPRRHRARERYRRFLDRKDVQPDLTFRAFLAEVGTC